MMGDDWPQSCPACAAEWNIDYSSESSAEAAYCPYCGVILE